MSRSRPTWYPFMIVLLTDFGLTDPYVGQLHARLAHEAPGVPVIDLWHNLPTFAVQRAAYLVAAYCRNLPAGSIVIAVVDPGVGSARAGIWLDSGERHFVGPDNGLFELIARRYPVHQCAQLTVPPTAAATFHGRDVFAPAAAQLATGATPPWQPWSLSRQPAWPDDLAEIVHIDHYGNALTGLRADTPLSGLTIHGRDLTPARTFSDRPHGEPFFYANSNGLWEIAAHSMSAADKLGLAVGDPVTPHA